MLLNEIQKDPQRVKDDIKAAIIAQETNEPNEPIIEANKDERGNIETVRKLLEWIGQYNTDLQKAIETKDIRTARLRIIELKGALEQVHEHVEKLASLIGLPEM